jgi:DNA-binding XRE family transcriptional regulator
MKEEERRRNLKHRRERLGLTQDNVGRALGVSASTICNVENNRERTQHYVNMYAEYLEDQEEARFDDFLYRRTPRAMTRIAEFFRGQS